MSNILLVHRFIKKLKLDDDFYELPYDLKIATITFTCKLNTLINVRTIGHYMDLNMNDIVAVKYGPDNGPDSVIRSLIKLKKNYKTKDPNKVKKKKDNFQNQVSVRIRIRRDRYIHVKLFNNGSMQVAGCKSVSNLVEVMTILCKKLLTYKFAYDTVLKKTIKKVYVSSPNFVVVSRITELSIRLINTSFHVGFMIDRVPLYTLLLEKGYGTTYDPMSHAGINLKYVIGADSISILIFESGSIIITGLKNKIQMFDAYEFIIKLLYENFSIIVKQDIERLLKRPDIVKMIKDEAEN
jgi:TATA-box binding protein (TBP) (component of TFIID and TFIIIB)